MVGAPLVTAFEAYAFGNFIGFEIVQLLLQDHFSPLPHISMTLGELLQGLFLFAEETKS
jgi:hypothetical protein